MQDRLKRRHAAAQEKDELDDRHADINEVQDLRGVLQARHQLAHGVSRHLRAENVNGAIRHVRHDRHDEHQHAHAADPMGEKAPELNAAAQRGGIGHHRSAGRGKPADRLKKRIRIIGDLAAEKKRKRPHKGKTDPRKRHDGKALSGVNGLMARAAHRLCAQTEQKGNG